MVVGPSLDDVGFSRVSITATTVYDTFLLHHYTVFVPNTDIRGVSCPPCQSPPGDAHGLYFSVFAHAFHLGIELGQVDNHAWNYHALYLSARGHTPTPVRITIGNYVST